MAKSKKQKRDEARERNLRFWHIRFERYAHVTHPSAGYHENVERFGQQRADFVAADAKRLFEKYCKEVGTDFHGNPIQ